MLHEVKRDFNQMICFYYAVLEDVEGLATLLQILTYLIRSVTLRI